MSIKGDNDDDDVNQVKDMFIVPSSRNLHKGHKRSYISQTGPPPVHVFRFPFQSQGTLSSFSAGRARAASRGNTADESVKIMRDSAIMCFILHN